jgi:archaellum biogenesis protein FlaJ (TadC family)
MNEVCLTIADWVNEELVRRARREQAANYLKGLVLPIQGTLVAILTLTTVLIEILNRFASISSTLLPASFVSPVDLHLLVLFNFILLFALAVMSSAAIYFTDGSTLFNLYYNLGLFLLISGLGAVICQTLAINVLSFFAGFESNLGALTP